MRSDPNHLHQLLDMHIHARIVRLRVPEIPPPIPQHKHKLNQRLHPARGQIDVLALQAVARVEALQDPGAPEAVSRDERAATLAGCAVGHQVGGVAVVGAFVGDEERLDG